MRGRALLFAALAVALWAVSFPAHAPVHLDTARDFLSARDCVERGVCAWSGPMSSLAPLPTGASWVHVVELVFRLGGGVTVIEGAVHGLAAIAAAWLGWIEAGRHGWRAGIVAALVVALAQAALSEQPNLWNPALMPLPAVAFFACLRRLDAHPSTTLVAAGSAALGLVVDVHPIGIALVPGWLGAVLTHTPLRRSPTTIGALACGPAWVIVSSSHAAAETLGVLLAHPWGCALGGATALLTTAAVALLSRRMPTARVAWVGGSFGALVLVGAIATGHASRAWYWSPLAPLLGSPIAALVARIAATRVRYGAVVVAGAVLVLLRVPRRVAPSYATPDHPVWTLRDAERLADRLARDGWSAQEALEGVDAAYGPLLVSSMTPFLPWSDAPGHRHLSIALSSPAPGTIPLDAGRYARMIAIPPPPAPVLRCVDEACEPAVRALPPRPGFEGLCYPARWRIDPAPKSNAYTLRYVLDDATWAARPEDDMLVWRLEHDTQGRAVVVANVGAGQGWRDLGWLPAWRAE